MAKNGIKTRNRSFRMDIMPENLLRLCRSAVAFIYLKYSIFANVRLSAVLFSHLNN